MTISCRVWTIQDKIPKKALEVDKTMLKYSVFKVQENVATAAEHWGLGEEYENTA